MPQSEGQDPSSVKKRIKMVFVIGFIVNSDFSITLPVLFLFLDSLGGEQSATLMLGWTLSIFALARFVFSPLLGKWADSRGEREVLLCGLSICCGGNLVYAFAQNVWIVFLGRLVAGSGAAIHGVALGYISKVTPPKKRGQVISAYWMVALLGMIVAPGLGALFSLINYGLLNAYRLPGFFMAILCFAGMVSVVFLFRGVTAPPAVSTTPPRKHLPPRALAHLVVQFSFGFELAVYQCIVTPLTASTMSWGELENNIFFLGIGVLVIMTVVITSILGNRIQAKNLLIIGSVLVFAGLLAGIEYPNELTTPAIVTFTFLLSAAFFVFGYATSVGLMPTVYSLSIEKLPQKGLLMGFLSSAQSIANFIGPIFAAVVLEYAGTNAVVIGMMAMIAFSLALQWIFYYDDVPEDEDHFAEPLLSDDDKRAAEDEVTTSVVDEEGHEMGSVEGSV